ncbi:MAG: pyridoxal phosphate-dependent aminotransferase [Proteobacteria bacterium]|nr:pyridoxal phosphate-dependent aminotransferase [Pseudomonadota bacterium]
MKYDFDEIIDRRNTDSAKWDAVGLRFGNENAWPMWVADTDFRSPRPVLEALEARVRHGVFGYTYSGPAYNQSLAAWMRERHGWAPDETWVSLAPGVLAGLVMCLEAFTEPGDGVLLQTPVYYPFFSVIRDNGRRMVKSDLGFAAGRYEMDLGDLEDRVRSENVKALILCSPHNPIGRAWSREELTRLGEICLEYGVFVLSDEIHSDLVYPPLRHVPFASISDEFAQNSMTAVSTSKTFNLPALQDAAIIIPDPERRRKYEDLLKARKMAMRNVLGMAASEAAWRHGRDYLDQLLEYLKGNLEFAKAFLAERAPEIRVVEPEATYLVWLDCRALDLDHRALSDFMTHQAEVALDPGHWFGEPGRGFMRMNIGCPRSTLARGLERLAKAVAGRR